MCLVCFSLTLYPIIFILQQNCLCLCLSRYRGGHAQKKGGGCVRVSGRGATDVYKQMTPKGGGVYVSEVAMGLTDV